MSTLVGTEPTQENEKRKVNIISSRKTEIQVNALFVYTVL